MQPPFPWVPCAAHTLTSNLLFVSPEPPVGPRRVARQQYPVATTAAHAGTGALLREEQDQFLQREYFALWISTAARCTAFPQGVRVGPWGAPRTAGLRHPQGWHGGAVECARLRRGAVTAEGLLARRCPLRAPVCCLWREAWARSACSPEHGGQWGGLHAHGLLPPGSPWALRRPRALTEGPAAAAAYKPVWAWRGFQALPALTLCRGRPTGQDGPHQGLCLPPPRPGTCVPSSFSPSCRQMALRSAPRRVPALHRLGTASAPLGWLWQVRGPLSVGFSCIFPGSVLHVEKVKSGLAWTGAREGRSQARRCGRGWFWKRMDSEGPTESRGGCRGPGPSSPRL